MSKDKQSTTSGRLQQLEILDQISVYVSQSIQLDSVCESIAEKSMEVFQGAAALELYLIDESGTLFLKSHRGLSPQIIETGTLQTGEGIAGAIADDGKARFLKTLLRSRQVNKDALKAEGLDVYGGVPIQSGAKMLGVLGIYQRSGNAFTEEEEWLLTQIGQRVAPLVRNAHFYEQAAMRARRFMTISQAITATRQLGVLEEVLQNITTVLVRSLGFDQSWIGLVDESSNTLAGRVGYGIHFNDEDVPVSYAIKKNSRNAALRALLDQKPVVYQFVNEVEDEEFKKWLVSHRVQSFGYVPIITGENSVGVIGVYYISDLAFEDEDVKTLSSVAEQAAIALENAQLYEKVKTSEQQYRTLFESTAAGLAIIDNNLEFVLVNRAFEAVCGFDRNALIGKKKFTEFLVQDEDFDNHLGHSEGWETRFLNNDGLMKEVHISSTRIPHTTNTLLSIIDMTEQRELERRLFRTEELAAIGELSAGIAHEIRNPLVAITTSVSLLKDEPDISEEGRQLLDVVKEESDHLAAIVDDFLRFARPKKPVFNSEDLNQLLKDVVRRNLKWDDKHIKWIEEYDENIPPVPLDRHQIQQVITNLFLNGLDAMENRGSIRIKSKLDQSRRDLRVCIEVADSGTGIEKTELARIFQPFYSTKDKGTGMGLAICRRIIDGHQGEITVISELGKGTLFTIQLPVERENSSIIKD